MEVGAYTRVVDGNVQEVSGYVQERHVGGGQHPMHDLLAPETKRGGKPPGAGRKSSRCGRGSGRRAPMSRSGRRNCRRRGVGSAEGGPGPSRTAHTPTKGSRANIWRVITMHCLGGARSLPVSNRRRCSIGSRGVVRRCRAHRCLNPNQRSASMPVNRPLEPSGMNKGTRHRQHVK